VIKKFFILIFALGSFAGAVLGPLALSGNLNQDGLNKLLGKPPVEKPGEAGAPGAEGAAPQGDVDPLVAALKAREEEIARREEEVRKQEESLRKMTADLEAMRDDLATMQTQIDEKIAREDDSRKERMQEVALSLAKMKPTNAAASLKSWSPEDAAAVLRLVKDRERGKILDAMGESAAPLLQVLQQPRI